MSGKVTALGLDVVTEKSGHVVAPIVPSVCMTPAAPSPLPLPYPVSGSSTEGIDAAPLRTKINGAKFATVGAALHATHGNEPGTMKDVVSLNTGGAASVLMGTPIVIGEMGMMAVTGSPVLANKGPGPTLRSAPAPAIAPIPGVAAGTLVMGGGPASGGSGASASGGEGSGSGNGDGSGNGAPSGQDGQCADGHPVDVITGRAYTLPAVDLELPGPLPLTFARVYSTSAKDRDVGLGFGWSHAWGWEVEVRRHVLLVWSDEGISTVFPPLAVGAEHVGPWGWALRRERDRFVLDKGDGVRRVFAALDEDARRWRLIEIADRNGNTIELTYDEAGKLCEVTDCAGRVIVIESNRAGRMAAIQIKNAREQGKWIAAARFAYSEVGDLVAVVDAAGHTARYAYDDDHRLTRETDRCGLSFCFAYDARGRCVETWGEYTGRKDPSLAEDVPAVLADGRKARGVHHVRLDFHPGRYTEVSDSTQLKRYFGNEHGLVDKKIVGYGLEEAKFDARGLKLAEVDGEGARTTYTRDAHGWVVMVVDPLGRATNYRRDAAGDVIEIVDPAGGSYEIQRDERGNVLHEADPTGAATSYTYDDRGLVTSITSPTGGVTRFAHDDAGNVVEKEEPGGARWRWSYDWLGQVVVEVDPLGNETRFAWTARGELAAVFHADGTSTRHAYDGEGRRVEIQGPGRRSVGLAWAGFHKLVARTSPDGQVVRFKYNREGELVEVRNELGERHKIIRNGAGLVVREETFDGRAISYKRDKAGRMVREQVANEEIARRFNLAGELVAREAGEGHTETFSYDLRGALKSAAWPGGEVRFERDAAGRVLREVQVVRGEEETVASLYDPSGGRVRRSTSRGLVEHVDRDGTGARRRTILDEVHDVHHARDPFGRESVRALGRGGRIHSEHDAMGRLSRRWASSPTMGEPDRVTVDHEHKYDEEGERSDTLDRRRGWTQYEYDAAGRLTSALHEATGAEEKFTYDAAGSTYPAGEEREYGPGGRLRRRGDAEYEWDAAGRLVEKRERGQHTRYAWDAAGRMVGAELPDGRRVSYVYDPLGRRVEARTAEQVTRFVWDGDTIAHAITEHAARDGDPVVEVRTFCFEDGGFVPWAQGEDRPDGYGGRSKRWSYFANDPIGTPEVMLDASGAVVAEVDRRAWGKVTAGGEATPIRFQGQAEDEATGLFYNHFRWYDAEAGLYLSPDPLGLAGGLRPFGYGVNPTGWIDPLGLARLPQDVRAKPNPPPAKPTTRPVGASPRQNAQCQTDAAAAQANGATDIRVNQQQLDAQGNRVGINRPDLGYTVDAGGTKQRVNIEYDTPSSGRGPAHEQRILDNDAGAQVILKVIP